MSVPNTIRFLFAVFLINMQMFLVLLLSEALYSENPFLRAQAARKPSVTDGNTANMHPPTLVPLESSEDFSTPEPSEDFPTRAPSVVEFQDVHVNPSLRPSGPHMEKLGFNMVPTRNLLLDGALLRCYFPHMNVSYVNLSFCELEEVPRELEHYKNISGLNLSHNNISRFDSDSFKHFNNLVSLDISYNNLNYTITSGILIRSNTLKLLNATFCGLGVIHPSSLDASSLTHFILVGNPGCEETRDLFEQLKSDIRVFCGGISSGRRKHKSQNASTPSPRRHETKFPGITTGKPIEDTSVTANSTQVTSPLPPKSPVTPRTHVVEIHDEHAKSVDNFLVAKLIFVLVIMAIFISCPFWSDLNFVVINRFNGFLGRMNNRRLMF